MAASRFRHGSGLAFAAALLAFCNVARAGADFADMPLHFARAADGAGESYVARGQAYGIRVGGEGATIAVRPAGGDRTMARVALRFAGASTNTVARPGNALPMRVNYLVGNDRDRWRTNLPTWGEVRYDGVYPGVDVVYYGNGRQLEYDLVLSPGTDPGTIAIDVEGADTLRLSDSGDLVMSLAGGELLQRRPVAYQEVGGDRRSVDASFVVGERGDVRFRLGDYDSSLPLVIDPIVSYVTYLGGSGRDSVADIATGAGDSAYLVGDTYSTAFPSAPGTSSSTRDAFVTRLDPAGSSALFTTFIGGGRNDIGDSIAIDEDGSIVIAGTTYSSDFPVTAGAVQSAKQGDFSTQDLFVTRLSPDGGTILASTLLGGTDHELDASVALHGSGSIFVTGATESADFPATPGAFQESKLAANRAALVVRLVGDLTALEYATLLSGSRDEWGDGIAVDEAGSAAVTGTAQSPDFPVTPDALKSSMNDDEFVPSDIFVARLDPTGSTLQYATHLGGNGKEFGGSLAYGPAGTLHVAGGSTSTDFPITPGAWQPVHTSVVTGEENVDIVYVRFNLAGNELLYSTFLGGAGSELPYDIAVDTAGNVAVVGDTYSDDYPVTPDAYQLLSRNNPAPWNGDGFLSLFTPTGQLRYSTFIGGEMRDLATGVAFDDSGNIYTGGYSDSADLQTTEGAFQPGYQGGTADGFVLKLTNVLDASLVQ